MSNETKVTVGGMPFRRFEGVKSFSTGDIQTVVQVRESIYGSVSTTYTLKKVKWSRYRIINWFKRLFIIIKYR